MISCQKVTKSYGRKTLFKDISFSIHKRERIGLVGRNGHGKSTLFRLIIGEETPDEGAVVIPRGYQIGYLSQHITFSKERVIDEVSLGLPVAERDATWRAEEVLLGLGFTLEDCKRPISEFSGGFQMRMLLAKTLVSSPDLLLLDEPTNFLDIVSIRWLERFLKNWQGELILITHDRQFMDRVVSHVMGIHRKKLRKYQGKTAHYYEQIATEEEVYEKNRQNTEKRIKQMEQFITKFRAKARQANLAQSRMKTLAKIKPDKKLNAIETLQFSFPFVSLPPKTVIRVEDLQFSYDGKEPYIINQLSFEIEPGDVVCVIGKNGRGKTTLIKLIKGELTPLHGLIKHNPQCSIAYYEQAHTADLNPNNSIEEELLNIADIGEASLVRNVCGAMMFPGDDVKKKIGVLSGGEKCRILLGKLLVSRHNVLLLDEPTHHLDMESTDAIIDAVKRFEGASIIVTHDERFLDEVATKLIVFRNNGVELYPGTYNEFLDQIGWEDEGVNDVPLSGHISEAKKNRSASKHERAVFIKKRSSILKPIEKEIQNVETKIIQKEKEMKDKTKALTKASANGEGDLIQELSIDLHALEQRIGELYDIFTQLHETYEERKKELAQEEEQL